MFAEMKDTVSERFRQSVDDVHNASSFLFPGAAEFSKHVLLAQKELLMGFTSIVNAQLESLEQWGKHAESEGAAGHQAHEKIRVDVHEEVTTRKKTPSKG
ncbi:MAG TPA: hypothetical protein VKB38_19970 [Terracidiphilus sp.]|nr:hypothetical protein [Terracidiphilus sp.]